MPRAGYKHWKGTAKRNQQGFKRRISKLDRQRFTNKRRELDRVKNDICNLRKELEQVSYARYSKHSRGNWIFKHCLDKKILSLNEQLAHEECKRADLEHSISWWEHWIHTIERQDRCPLPSVVAEAQHQNKEHILAQRKK